MKQVKLVVMKKYDLNDVDVIIDNNLRIFGSSRIGKKEKD